MQRRKFTSVVVTAGGLWALSASPALRAADLTESDAALGIRAALERGAVAAVGLLGRNGGFLDNPKVRIELPGYLKDAAKMLQFTGQQRRVDELVTAMNRAAEAAVPKARLLLVKTAKAMSVEDALQIVRGSEVAVTDFFVRKTREPLTEQFLPIVAQSTQRVALAAKFNAVAGQAAKLGLLKPQDADIDRYVTGKALDGLYLMIAEEERRIRRDPIGSGSAILKKVFGTN